MSVDGIFFCYMYVDISWDGIVFRCFCVSLVGVVVLFELTRRGGCYCFGFVSVIGYVFFCLPGHMYCLNVKTVKTLLTYGLCG